MGLNIKISNARSHIKQVWVIFTHLKFWVAIHNFKCVTITLAGKGIKCSSRTLHLQNEILDPPLTDQSTVCVIIPSPRLSIKCSEQTSKWPKKSCFHLGTTRMSNAVPERRVKVKCIPRFPSFFLYRWNASANSVTFKIEMPRWSDTNIN